MSCPHLNVPDCIWGKEVFHALILVFFKCRLCRLFDIFSNSEWFCLAWSGGPCEYSRSTTKKLLLSTDVFCEEERKKIFVCVSGLFFCSSNIFLMWNKAPRSVSMLSSAAVHIDSSLFSVEFRSNFDRIQGPTGFWTETCLQDELPFPPRELFCCITVVLHERGPLFRILGPPKQQVSNIFSNTDRR